MKLKDGHICCVFLPNSDVAMYIKKKLRSTGMEIDKQKNVNPCLISLSISFIINHLCFESVIIHSLAKKILFCTGHEGDHSLCILEYRIRMSHWLTYIGSKLKTLPNITIRFFNFEPNFKTI